MLDRLRRLARESRREAGFTLAELAALARVSESSLSRFERGVTLPRDLDRIVAVYERALGLPEGELWRRAQEEST